MTEAQAHAAAVARRETSAAYRVSRRLQWCTGKVRGCDSTGRPSCTAVECFYAREPCPSRACNGFQPIGGRCARCDGDGDETASEPPVQCAAATTTTLWRDRARLERLYVDEGLSSAVIARRFGTSDVTILEWLHRFSIPIRDPADRRHHHGRHTREGR